MDGLYKDGRRNVCVLELDSAALTRGVGGGGGAVGVGALKGICLILLCKTELYYTSLQFRAESLLKVWIPPPPPPSSSPAFFIFIYLFSSFIHAPQQNIKSVLADTVVGAQGDWVRWMFTSLQSGDKTPTERHV